MFDQNVCLTVNKFSLDSDPACTMVVVYDPGAGFVTGGGWMESPAGAYRADESLGGKVTFGFISKYPADWEQSAEPSRFREPRLNGAAGASIPTGNTAFHFDLAGLAFSSQSYEWLVVNRDGKNAQFKGSGTINGMLAPNGKTYHFILWAGDGSPSTFRIKIWWEDAAGEHTVYDNGAGGTSFRRQRESCAAAAAWCL